MQHRQYTPTARMNRNADARGKRLNHTGVLHVYRTSEKKYRKEAAVNPAASVYPSRGADESDSNRRDFSFFILCVTGLKWYRQLPVCVNVYSLPAIFFYKIKMHFYGIL